jgi:hypothetical protein
MSLSFSNQKWYQLFHSTANLGIPATVTWTKFWSVKQMEKSKGFEHGLCEFQKDQSSSNECGSIGPTVPE